VLAARGQRETDTGTETVENLTERALLRRQAAGVHARAASLTALLILLTFLV
jgi:hypothetical protein